MSLDALSRRDVKTSLGVVPVWSAPEIFASRRPLLLAIAGLFAGADDLSRLPEVMAPVADAAILRIPGSGPPPLREASLEGFARAVGELIGQQFADRPVVLLGVSIGAAAALGVRAPAVRRIVAVEPILATGELWPLEGPVRAHLRGLPRGHPSHDLYWRLFGLDAERCAARDHGGLLKGLSVPVDVLLAGQPLAPERKLEGFPSLVPEALHARLAALPQVRLHQAPGAGHNVQAAAGKQLTELLFEACRRAAADAPHEARGLDEPLLEATPLGASRIAHWGPGGPAFAGAYLGWNPTAE
ncbi:MAG TPA: alpha/beta hydrolase, partial [Phenylobacterium sp.]|uniref:alpha/beta fold hydrolase n=1 Tax=Phenylobacterium sp. TaxID=1871053 RepID=UPI002B488FE3